MNIDTAQLFPSGLGIPIVLAIYGLRFKWNFGPQFCPRNGLSHKVPCNRLRACEK